jgi:hypothetical protein
MSIVDRLVRRLCAHSLEALVHEAVSAHVASVIKDPLHEPLIYGDATRLHVHPTAVVNNGDGHTGSLPEICQKLRYT